MKIYIKKVDGLKIPAQANPGEDAAYDIVATTGPMIIGEKIERPLDGMPLWKRVAFIEYGTNMFIAPEDQRINDFSDVMDGGACLPPQFLKYHLLLHSRSSISKQNLVLANSVGVIDNGYRGEIRVRFKYIFQPEDLFVISEVGANRVYGLVNNENIYQMGDKICQIKASPNIPIEFQLINILPESGRGIGGFGSTDKK